ncbi:hypothetical protein TNCV_1950321 [Trichonephila clavipes]|nr:hypothetical protein TNCV_1950321 [Trichonephila clavipes]
MNPDHSLECILSLFLEYSKCIKQSSSPVGHVLSPVLYRAPSVRINLIVCLIELCTSFELRDKFGGGAYRSPYLSQTVADWQIEIDEADREKDGILLPPGLYEFKVMPFGLL